MTDRVAFLLEDTGERISALLNPASVRVRRRAGLRTLDERPGTIAGAGGTDDVLVATGGGRTEIELQLLFDIGLVAADPNRVVTDVRELTGPLWRLSENGSRLGSVPALRVVWGMRWNVCALVDSVSERLERFAANGAPTRSLLTMRLVRTAEPDITAHRPATQAATAPATSTMDVTPRAPFTDVPHSMYHEVLGGDNGEGERLDLLAAHHYGDARYWRAIASVNGLTDGLPWVTPGRVLVMPPIDVLAALPDEPLDDEIGTELDADQSVDGVDDGDIDIDFDIDGDIDGDIDIDAGGPEES
jgi:hypothetical protein